MSLSSIVYDGLLFSLMGGPVVMPILTAGLLGLSAWYYDIMDEVVPSLVMSWSLIVCLATAIQQHFSDDYTAIGPVTLIFMASFMFCMGCKALDDWPLKGHRKQHQNLLLFSATMTTLFLAFAASLFANQYPLDSGRSNAFIYASGVMQLVTLSTLAAWTALYIIRLYIWHESRRTYNDVAVASRMRTWH